MRPLGRWRESAVQPAGALGVAGPLMRRLPSCQVTGFQSAAPMRRPANAADRGPITAPRPPLPRRCMAQKPEKPIPTSFEPITHTGGARTRRGGAHRAVISAMADEGNAAAAAGPQNPQAIRAFHRRAPPPASLLPSPQKRRSSRGRGRISRAEDGGSGSPAPARTGGTYIRFDGHNRARFSLPPHARKRPSRSKQMRTSRRR